MGWCSSTDQVSSNLTGSYFTAFISIYSCHCYPTRNLIDLHLCPVFV